MESLAAAAAGPNPGTSLITSRGSSPHTAPLRTASVAVRRSSGRMGRHHGTLTQARVRSDCPGITGSSAERRHRPGGLQREQRESREGQGASPKTPQRRRQPLVRMARRRDCDQLRPSTLSQKGDDQIPLESNRLETLRADCKSEIEKVKGRKAAFPRANPGSSSTVNVSKPMWDPIAISTVPRCPSGHGQRPCAPINDGASDAVALDSAPPYV
jgi:hypothetical protein